jgi:hypothetical protein
MEKCTIIMTRCIQDEYACLSGYNFIHVKAGEFCSTFLGVFLHTFQLMHN